MRSCSFILCCLSSDVKSLENFHLGRSTDTLCFKYTLLLCACYIFIPTHILGFCSVGSNFNSYLVRLSILGRKRVVRIYILDLKASDVEWRQKRGDPANGVR